MEQGDDDQRGEAEGRQGDAPGGDGQAGVMRDEP